MATYQQLQKYVKDHYGVSVKTCWIAHMKEICGLDVKMSHRRYDPNKRVNPCPENKKSMIEDAFKHYSMI